MIVSSGARVVPSEGKGPGGSGLWGEKSPRLTGVLGGKGPEVSGVSEANPAKTRPETPPPNARAGREPLNPGTRNPPDPPEGGSTQRRAIIEETYLSQRGRRRRRLVNVDLDEIRRGLGAPGHRDLVDWQRIRSQLQRRVGEDMFAIWLGPVELIATDGDQRLVLAAPGPMAAWTSKRFDRLIAAIGSEIGRDHRFATEAERRAFDACAPTDPITNEPKEAAG